ncbi:MAG: TIGR00730 family Rossman fold protein [Chitinophagaceae bacterium]
MKRLTVFCGSSFGTSPIYEQQSALLGKALAERGIDLVYGGANVGLMGVVADAVLKAGGKVFGVLPRFLKTKEIAHQHLTELILVETMHERKHKMDELSDGVIALPGGFGTMEEFFEMLTWAQLGLHKKPVAILNVDGFYDELIQFLQTMVDKGFLKEVNRRMLLVSSDVTDLLDQMMQYKAPAVTKWIDKENV